MSGQGEGTNRPRKDDFGGKIRRILERPVYVAISVLITLIAAAGFLPGMIRKAVARNIPPDAIIHVHVAVHWIWLALFFVQTVNAALGRMRQHRKLGKWLIAYGVLIWVIGEWVTLNRFVKQVHQSQPDLARSVNLAPFVDTGRHGARLVHAAVDSPRLSCGSRGSGSALTATQDGGRQVVDPRRGSAGILLSIKELMGLGLPGCRRPPGSPILQGSPEGRIDH